MARGGFGVARTSPSARFLDPSHIDQMLIPSISCPGPFYLGWSGHFTHQEHPGRQARGYARRYARDMGYGHQPPSGRRSVRPRWEYGRCWFARQSGRPISPN